MSRLLAVQPALLPALTPMAKAMRGMGSSKHAVRSLFSAGEQGAWYEPHDPNQLLQRRNLLTYSEQLTNAVWVKNAIIPVDSPGALSAIKASGAGNALRTMQQVITGTAGTQYVGAFDLKAGTLGWVTLSLFDAASRGTRVNVNLLTGTIGSRSDFNAPVSPAVAIEPRGDGVYRLSVSMGASIAGNVTMRLYPADGDDTVSFLSSALSTSDALIYAGMAQLEVGSAATSYQTITDFTTEYAGTTAVERGPEKATANYFTSAGGYDNTTTSTSATSFIATPGALAPRVAFTILGAAAGKVYEVNFRVASVSAGTVTLFSRTATDGGGTTINNTATLGAGQYGSLLFTATGAATSALWVSSNAGASFSVDNISIREVITSYTPNTVTMYQDSAGTTPVTAVEQPVGLLLDKMGGYNYGDELVPDPDFNASGSWGFNQPVAGSVTVSGGVVTVNSTDGSYCGVTVPNFVPVVGKTYEVTMNVASITSGQPAMFLGNVQHNIATTGITTKLITALTTQPAEVKRGIGGSPNSFTVTSFSVREITGRTGLVRGPELFTAAAPVMSNGTLTDLGGGRYRITATSAAAVACTKNGTYPLGFHASRINLTANSHARPVSAYGRNAPIGAGSASLGMRYGMGSASGTTELFWIGFTASAAGEYIEFQDFSIRELAGNHASQSTAAARPTLSARVNLLTKTEQVDDAVWIKGDTTVTANALAAPDGSMTFDLLTEGTLGTSQVYNQVTAAPGTYTGQTVLVRGNHDWVRVLVNDGTNGGQCWVNLATQTFGTIQNMGTGTGTTATMAVNGSFVLVTVTTTLPAGTTAVRISTLSAAANGSGVRVNGGTRYMGRAQVEYGSTATRYQRVNTATDYDTAGFPHYLKFDGVDDNLKATFLGSIAHPITATLAGMGESAVATMAFIDGPDNAQRFQIAYDAGSAKLATYQGTTAVTGSLFMFGAKFVATVTGNSPTSLVRQNGAQTGVGNAGNHSINALNIGCDRANGARLKGNIYGLVLRGALSTDAQMTATERYIANKSGVTL